MEWTAVIAQALIAIAAVAGALTAFFKWRVKRENPNTDESPTQVKGDIKNPSIQAGRDIISINRSFNKTIEAKNVR